MEQIGRVLLTNFSPAWGGGEYWFYEVGKGLINRGFSVEWWTRRGSRLSDRLHVEGLPHFTSRGKASEILLPGQFRKLTGRVARFRPDAILLNASHELKLGGLAAKRAGVPHIVFRRGVSYPLKQNPVNRWYFQRVVTGFLANGQTTFANNQKAFPQIASLPHAIIPNGIDLRPFRDWDPRPEGQQILMSARLSPEKGIDRALRVFATMQAQGFTGSLRILGDGPQRASLQALARSLGIASRVTFTGFVEDVKPFLRKSGAFLFTPRFGEGTSFALLEAMAAGLPCIAFEAPSLDEVVLDGKTGYLIAPDEEQEMAQKLLNLFADEPLRRRMGEAGRQRAFQHFSLERVVDQVSLFLTSLINEHG